MFATSLSPHIPQITYIVSSVLPKYNFSKEEIRTLYFFFFFFFTRGLIIPYTALPKTQLKSVLELTKQLQWECFGQLSKEQTNKQTTPKHKHSYHLCALEGSIRLPCSSPKHPSNPLLNLLQFTNVYFVLGRGQNRMQYLKDCRIEARYHSIILSDLSFTLSFLLLQPISCASLNTSKDAIDHFYFQGGLLAHIQLGPWFFSAELLCLSHCHGLFHPKYTLRLCICFCCIL